MFALFHLGMVPGILVFKDLGKVWIFMIFVLAKKSKRLNVSEMAPDPPKRCSSIGDLGTGFRAEKNRFFVFQVFWISSFLFCSELFHVVGHESKLVPEFLLTQHRRF